MPDFTVYGSYTVLFDWHYIRDTKNEVRKLAVERLRRIIEKGNVADPEITNIVEEEKEEEIK